MLIRCEHDPFKVPVGRAWFPGAVGGHGFYTYEEAPRSRARSNTRYLRLLEQTKKGYLAERSRLIYDEYGSPRYERMLGTGERSRHEYQILVFLNRSKELVK